MDSIDISVTPIVTPGYGPENSRLWKLTRGERCMIVDAPGNPSTSINSMYESFFDGEGYPFFFVVDRPDSDELEAWYYDQDGHRPGREVDSEFVDHALEFLKVTSWQQLTQFN